MKISNQLTFNPKLKYSFFLRSTNSLLAIEWNGIIHVGDSFVMLVTDLRCWWFTVIILG